MTSREDPCPLANQEAMESGLPVVAFSDSGGAPELLGESGVVVPYIDVNAMAAAVRDLLVDPDKRSDLGRRGQELIRGHFTWARFMDEFHEILRADYGYRPALPLKVSVVVPNYGYARYLEDRLRSIFDQTVTPFEIIFLDNCSPDDSVEVARRLAQISPAPMQIVVNAENNGSPFRQWVKGLKMATGDLVWIAESDDLCHPQFLERLLPEFYDPEVVLAYSQSALVGPDGERLEDDFLAHTDEISATRWRSWYSVSGLEEVQVALSQKNTIPNASAVLFRRPQEFDFAAELEGFRFAGDWLFYAMQLRKGKIAYRPEILNYYRRHPQSVTSHSVRGEAHAVESLYVKARLLESFPISRNVAARSIWQTVSEYNWLTAHFDLKRPNLTANPHVASSLDRVRAAMQARRETQVTLKILLIVNDMNSGTDVLSAIGLANALVEEHEVFLCIARPRTCDSDMLECIDSRITLMEGDPGQGPSWLDCDPLSEQGRRRVEILRELIRFYDIDVMHSLSSDADLLAREINEDRDIPWFAHVVESHDQAPEISGDTASLSMRAYSAPSVAPLRSKLAS